ncbi:MAG: Rid family detoxifying hydrolase [Peptostreptococcaceae bacterium]|nr:Rid family detoxifying hydrolase [Peptostreptococcaceae bacterium]
MKNLATEKAPAAIGPYSQGYEANGFVFTSGQLPVNLQTGAIEEEIKAATIASLNNVKAIVEAAGLSVNHIIKTTVFLRDMNDFPQMNEVYSEFFGNHAPARSTVQVAKLPKDAIVEIEAIAARA